MALPFNWEPFFPVKLAMGMSVEGLVGVLSLRNGSIYIKRLKSLSHYQSSVTEFPRERMNQRVLVFSWAWQITKLSGDSFFFSFFRKETVFLIILDNKKHESIWDFKVTPEGITSSSEDWNARQDLRVYLVCEKNSVTCCYQCNAEPLNIFSCVLCIKFCSPIQSSH